MKHLARASALASWLAAAALVPASVVIAGGWRVLAAMLFASVLAAGLVWVGLALFEHGLYLEKHGK